MDLIDDDDVGGDDRTAGEKTVAAVVDSAATPSRQPVPVEKVELLSMDPDSLTEQYQRIGPLISRQGRVLADAIRDLMIAEAQRKAVEGKLYLQARTHLRFNPPETADGKKKEASDTYVEAYWKSQDPFRSEWLHAISAEASAAANKKVAEADYLALTKQGDYLISMGADRRAEMSRLDPHIKDPKHIAKGLSAQANKTL